MPHHGHKETVCKFWKGLLLKKMSDTSYSRCQEPGLTWSYRSDRLPTAYPDHHPPISRKAVWNLSKNCYLDPDPDICQIERNPHCQKLRIFTHIQREVCWGSANLLSYISRLFASGAAEAEAPAPTAVSERSSTSGTTVPWAPHQVGCWDNKIYWSVC